MKYRQLNDAIDPEVMPSGLALEVDKEGEPLPNDAYVIGESGESIQMPDAEDIGNQVSGPKPWVKPAAVVLSLLFVALTVWNLNRLTQGPPPTPKPTPVQVKQALYLGVMKIDAYRRTYGVVPDMLGDAGLPDSGPYTYSRIDQDHYLISFESAGEKLEYDSSNSKESFFGSANEVLSMGASK